MSLWIKVKSVDKKCEVMINLDKVVEIAPLKNGHTALFYADNATSNGVRSYNVENPYTEFQQFALEPVSTAMLGNIGNSVKKEPLDIPTLIKDKKNTEKK
jgi:hypothetical protein